MNKKNADQHVEKSAVSFVLFSVLGIFVGIIIAGLIMFFKDSPVGLG